MFNFSDALCYLKKGAKITRDGWNGKGLWIELQIPDEHSKMTRPYMFIVSPKGSTNQFGEDAKEFEMCPWVPSQTDIMQDDWIIL